MLIYVHTYAWGGMQSDGTLVGLSDGMEERFTYAERFYKLKGEVDKEILFVQKKDA